MEAATVNSAMVLEALKRLFLSGLDVENLIETGDFKNFVDFRFDATQSQLRFRRLDLFVHRDQLAKRSTRKIFDDAEIQHDLLSTVFVDEGEKLVSNILDVRLVKDLFIDELGDSDPTDFFDVQPTLTS
jgi:AAA+ ATPase superfamily predicted ATPase